MITISLCMIVKNEQQTLSRCLESVRDVVDEIIIVDTGSTDGTKDVAKKYTDKIYDFKWIDDFSSARNFSFSKASMDYCMWLDADDIISEKNKVKLLKLKNRLSTNQVDVIMLKYETGFDENNNPNFFYYRERILKNNSNAKWCGQIHETIPPFGKIVYEDISITHRKLKSEDADRNINIFEKMISNNVKLSPRQQFYYARELYYHKNYLKAVDIFEGFLNCEDGWIENKIDACKIMSYCYSEAGEKNKILSCLLRSFQFDKPRAEICCEIGNYFLSCKDYSTAIFWYKIALDLPQDYKSGGFISTDYYGYIPNIQLCVCYYHIGQIDKARMFNQEAGKYKPKSEAYLTNKLFFEKIFKGDEHDAL